MYRTILALFLLALPAKALACDYGGVQQFFGGYGAQQFNLGYAQAFYAPPPMQFVAVQQQAYAYAPVQQFAVQSYAAPVVQSYGYGVQQFAAPVQQFGYGVQQFAVRQRFGFRQRLNVIDIDRRGPVRRLLNDVFGGRRRAAIIVH